MSELEFERVGTEIKVRKDGFTCAYLDPYTLFWIFRGNIRPLDADELRQIADKLDSLNGEGKG